MQPLNQKPPQLKRFGARGVRQRDRPQYFQCQLAALAPDTLDVIGDLTFYVDHQEPGGDERIPADIYSCAGFRKVPDRTVKSGMRFWNEYQSRQQDALTTLLAKFNRRLCIARSIHTDIPEGVGVTPPVQAS
jgi:hypothetical protein